MALSKDARKWLDKQSNEFMEPFAEYFTADESREIADEQRDSCHDEVGDGWYSRLSAPGYLDCTDWIGPYATEDEAFEALFEQYGDG